MGNSGSIDDRYEGTQLTEKELQILRLIAEGHSNKAIGRIISISQLTVKNHVQRILRRLGCTSRVTAIYRGYEEGLITPPPLAPTLEVRRRRHVDQVAVPDRLGVLLPAKEEHVKDVTFDATDWLRYGRVLITETHRTVRIDGKDVDVRGTLFDLLLVFIKQPGHIFSRESLLNRLLGRVACVEDRVVDVYIRRLRVILSAHNIHSIETVRDHGYRLKPPSI